MPHWWLSHCFLNWFSSSLIHLQIRSETEALNLDLVSLLSVRFHARSCEKLHFDVFNRCTCETESSMLICSVKTNISRWVRSVTFTEEKNKTQKHDVKRRQSKAKPSRLFIWTRRSLWLRQRWTRRTSQMWHVINWCFICAEWCIIQLIDTIHHGNHAEYDFFLSYFSNKFHLLILQTILLMQSSVDNWSN